MQCTSTNSKVNIFYSKSKPLIINSIEGEDPSEFQWILNKNKCTTGPTIIITETNIAGKNFFDKLAPMDNKLYKHTTEGKDDMPAHIKSTLTNNQITLSVKDKKLMLGTWQGLYLFEHRLEKHIRVLSHHLIGN